MNTPSCYGGSGECCNGRVCKRVCGIGCGSDGVGGGVVSGSGVCGGGDVVSGSGVVVVVV